MEEIMLKIDNVSKQYKLGQIGGTTLREELQRKHALRHGKEDPTKKIGAKEYKIGETFMALNGVSFEVKKGERVGIIGHNGAGKSTLLKLISRVTAPTDGAIYMNGRVTSMLEVGTGFSGELTGRENIYMNGAILGMTKKEIDAKIEDIIEFSEVRQFIDTPVKRYSSGMYVKLAFAVAAHLDSEIMIMDEVLAVGDMAFQKKCLDKMNDVSRQEGRTILYVSHNMNTIRQLCDRVVVLDHGKVVFDGDVTEAIAIYTKQDRLTGMTIDYFQIPRFHWLRDTKIRTLSAEIVNHKNNVYTYNEPLQFKLTWQYEVDVTDAHLRIEYKKVDRTPVGTSIVPCTFSGKMGEIAGAVFSDPMALLSAGTYTMNYTFYIKDEFGTNINIDCVCGLSFTKEGKPDIIWDAEQWGNVVLPEVEMIHA